MKQEDAAMAVLVQQQLSPDLSFVLHTVNPLDGDKDTMYAELAVGLGETLASGTRGSPWRLAVNKSSGVQLPRFADGVRSVCFKRTAHSLWPSCTTSYASCCCQQIASSNLPAQQDGRWQVGVACTAVQSCPHAVRCTTSGNAVIQARCRC